MEVRFVGQAVKTPPSHGGNTGSIPVRTAKRKYRFVFPFFISWDAFSHEIKQSTKITLRQTEIMLLKQPATGGECFFTEFFFVS